MQKQLSQGLCGCVRTRMAEARRDEVVCLTPCASGNGQVNGTRLQAEMREGHAAGWPQEVRALLDTVSVRKGDAHLSSVPLSLFSFSMAWEGGC